MKVNVLQTAGQSSQKTHGGTAAAAGLLKEGDIVKAEILSVKKGTVAIKTENGQILRARHDPEVILSPGDKVTLEVSGKEGGTISLAIRKEDPGAEESPGGLSGQNGAAKGFEDTSLVQYANKLAELKMPVTEDTARLMSEIIGQNPDLSPDEAAFLASNKLTSDTQLIQAALSLISGGDKTDAMIMKLLTLLGTSDLRNTGDSAPGASQLPDFQPSTPDSRLPAPPGREAPLMEGFSLIRESVEGTLGRNDTVVISNAQAIIPQGDSIMQRIIVEKPVEILQEGFNNDIKTAEQAATEKQNTVLLPLPGETPSDQELPGAQQKIPEPSAARAQQPVQQLVQQPVPQHGAPPDAPHNTEIRDAIPKAFDSSAAADPGAGRALAQILSGIPEFQSAPPAAIERFSDMLYRVAMDSAEINKNDNEKLEVLIDKLFTRIDKNEDNTGERLKNAREELLARVTLIEEAISRAAPHAKAEMLVQTGRLTNHVRLLNNIDQFVYLQLPVLIGDERKTAELYMFKKKGGKRADPDNVNILLALDLENLGRWEGLINFRNRNVSVQMEVRGVAEKEFFGANTFLLHELLAEAGFKLVNTDIKFSKEETTPLTALSSFDRYAGVRAGTVDFMI